MFNNIYKNYGCEGWIIKGEGLCYIVVYCVVSFLNVVLCLVCFLFVAWLFCFRYEMDEVMMY